MSRMVSLFLIFISFNLFASDAKSPTQKPFQSFTGKILGNKVRLRTQSDLEGHIVRLLNKNDLLLIVGEVGDFWAVEPPRDIHAFVFRSYVLDNIVEANRVNIRLEPHIDAPVIGQLEKGEKIEGEICSTHHKWLQINPPNRIHFYISKEFIEKAGSPEYLTKMIRRKAEVDHLLQCAYFSAEAESKKLYSDMNPQEAFAQFESIILDYKDFPDHVDQAKSTVAALQENYLNKKIAYLEAKAEGLDPDFTKSKSQEVSPFKIDPNLWGKRNLTDSLNLKMKFWEPIEDSLYLSWSAFHTNKKMNDFYEEQKVNAITLSGVVESYNATVKNKPGDFILRSKDMNIAYLYSTQVNLDDMIGKRVTLLLTPRPNHHFAFPAYYVLDVH